MSATHSGMVFAPNRSHFLDIVFARDDPSSLSLGVGGGAAAEDDDDDDDARTIARRRPRRPRRPTTTARTPPATATDVVMSRDAMKKRHTRARTDGDGGTRAGRAWCAGS